MKKDNNEIRSSAHLKYKYHYHIVFAPKYRRKEIYGQLRKDIGQILRKLREQRVVEILGSRSMPRPHPYVSEHSPAHKCITIHGISQEEKTMKEYIDPFTGNKTKQAKTNSRS